MNEVNIVMLGVLIMVSLVSIALGYLIARQKKQSLVESLAAIETSNTLLAQQHSELQLGLDALRGEYQALQIEQGKLETANEGLVEAQNQTQQRLVETESQLFEARDTIQEKTTSEVGLSAQVHAEQRRFDELQQRHTEQTEQFTSLQQEHADLVRRFAELDTQLQTKQQHFDEQMTLLQDSKETLKKEFENLANGILEKKSEAFKKLNVESMSHVLNPIQSELKGFKARVEDIHGKESEQRVQLRTELENLQKLNREITDQADKLTTALQGEKKVQGNWGELMLENVLDNSGLRLGSDYKREVSFNSEEGKLRPDAIVYLPQQKHLVIDAKTSLNAYTRYVNSMDDETRNIALKDHCQAVRDRLSELASKDYCKLPGINSPEVVIMFIPIESAYVEALKADEQLFQFALQNNILIATPTTLLTSLNIVRQLWRFEEQNKHTAELASRAEKFYNKLSTFLTSMQGVGSQLDKAKSTYDKALGQLVSGPGNLIKQASEFKQLGVSVKKELPDELVDKANLELGQDELSKQVDSAL